MPVRAYVTINGVQTFITDSDILEVVDINPLGSSQAKRITERSPLQDGDTDLNFLLEPRIITIVLQCRLKNATYETFRRLINKLFKATNTTIILGIIFDDGTHYCIDTKSLGNIDLPINIMAELFMRIAVRLRAANPIFYNPTEEILVFSLSAGLRSFQIPTMIPTFVGSGDFDETQVLNYAGTYRDYPIITIHGPATDLIITNESTGDKLSFDGYTITADDFYTIDLRFGNKLIYKNDDPSDDRISELSFDSQLATFAIEADPVATDGINTFRVQGTDFTSETVIEIAYHARYDGI